MDDANPDSAVVAEVRVLPGFPDGRPTPEGVEGGIYPTATTDLVKVIKERGLSVAYLEDRESRSTITLKSGDIWIPILLFAYEVAVSGAGDLLASAIRDLFGSRSERATLHVKCGYEMPDGETDWFEATGPGSQVLEALSEWKPTER